MNYFVIRDGQEFGPYTLADLQRYVLSGNIAATDLARSEGMTEPRLVSEIIGTIPVPTYMPPAPAMPAMPEYPDPPNLHWGLVLLFEVITCGTFSVAWNIVESAFIKKVEPESKAIFWYIASAAVFLMIFFNSFWTSFNHQPKNASAGVLQLVYAVLVIVGRFVLKSSIEDHYNTAEPMGVSLSGVMTFFFATIYFQYYFNDINRRKKADRLGYMAA